MENVITLSDMLSEMKKLDAQKKPIPFSVVVRSFNLQNKRGGKLIHYPNATLMQAPKTKGVKRLADPKEFKNPNHWENRTRNIMTLEGERKIHISFIVKFNGKTVIY